MRHWNFSAGPATISAEVLQEARGHLLDWHGLGASINEISHRSAAFLDLYRATVAALRRILGISSEYEILLLQGGARAMFDAIPMNLAAAPGASVDHLISGHWSRCAWQQAQKYIDAAVAVDCGSYRQIPLASEWQLNPSAVYCHYCPNETIHGVRFPQVPQVSVPLVADMSSMLLTEAIDVDNYGVIYACTQKNLGIAGLTLVIVRKDLLGAEHPLIPTVWSFARQAERESMLNTPPTFAIYMLRLTLEWFERRGGVQLFDELNRAKAEELYNCIDNSDGFYKNPVQPEYRSRVNIPFSTGDADLDAQFVSEATSAGLLHLKGHRAVGGMRASLYNAMPLDGTHQLTKFMADFASKNARAKNSGRHN